MIENLTQSDKVSRGVFVLKVCDFFFLRGGTWEKVIILYSINHIIVSVDCRVHCNDSMFHVSFDKISTYNNIIFIPWITREYQNKLIRY